MSAEQLEERQRKINEGADVVAFGFSRVLGPSRRAVPTEPQVWEGDYA